MAHEDLSTLPRSRKEAKALGNMLYFTGKPCKHGHAAERRTDSGDCCQCKRGRDRAAIAASWIAKEIKCLSCGETFLQPFQAGMPPGFCSEDCRAKAIRKSRAKWEQRNPEKRKAQQRKRIARHRSGKTPLWVQSLASRSAYQRERRKNDPDFRMGLVLRTRIWNALNGGRGEKMLSTSGLLGCSVPHLRAHLAAQFQPGMSWDNYGEWHVDHIRPCASFDLTDPEQQKECFHYSNLQPLWAEDNMRKGAKWAA